ncbi:VOC family protein [Shewanella sp. AS16]|uniref:VOC family protein n=1 Tax=Shewanella sp. AS16 TaxID=2907625 RepID=UPI001F21E654|nr:VOC family protein [Shewanella sp. AS16]MCE9687150.1 VOC family protein [Shewanella sp. AS16]
MYIPPGYSCISPYMLVEGAEGLVAFLTQAFDAVETSRSLRADGKIANAEMRIGDCIFMLSEATEICAPMPASYYLYVENADASMAKALAAGATQILGVADRPYGDRQGGVRDCCGNLWWISQHLQPGAY